MNERRRRPDRRQIGGHPETGYLLGMATVVLGFLAVVYVLSQGFYTVQENQNAIVLRFGKYLATTSPGFHLCIPFVDEVIKVNVTEERRLRLPFGIGPEREGSVNEEETLMLTGDLNAASVEWSVQWKISDPKAKVFRFYDPRDPAGDGYIEAVIVMAARMVMNRLVGDYSIDEVLTEKRSEIRIKARDATQEILDRYQSGIMIMDLQMQRVRPPDKVRPAFDAVNSSIQERDRLENEANRERNKLIPEANAERDKKIREAEGYAARRKAEVQGEIDALKAKFEAYQAAPDITRKRLYLETMEKVLSNVDDKVILDSGVGNVLPLLPLGEGGAQ
ncbi:MAG: FtsH protease activity modulator HflK [Planctomycetaceae bacterium]|nr:FtsH protease activity modulator HflK [Planctomycetaceae bacterium]